MTQTIINALYRLLAKQKLFVFIYHRVLPESDPMRASEPTMAEFDWQMRVLSTHFNPISLTEALHLLSENNLPPKAVCVTFDDGYLNNLTCAQPILAKYNIPATVYVATQFSSGINMWNDRVLHLFRDPNTETVNLGDYRVQLSPNWEERRAHATKILTELKYLTPEKRTDLIDHIYTLNPHTSEAPFEMMTPHQIRTLGELDVEIGAHTHSHPILKTLNPDEQEEEIAKSKQLLEEWTGKPVKHFAYPNGIIDRDFDNHTLKCVKKLGFESAVVTNWGVVSRSTNRFLLPRFTPWDNSELRFQLRLLRNAMNS